MEKTVFIYFAVTAIIVAAMLIIAIKVFGEQKVKNWLVWAVGEAEKQFGSGTGQLKLRSVYNEFVKMFPKLSLIITFARFSFLVDEALDILAVMLKNEKIADVISNNKEE